MTGVDGTKVIEFDILHPFKSETKYGYVPIGRELLLTPNQFTL